MSEFLLSIVEGIKDNAAFIGLTTFIGSAVTGVVYYIVKKVIPNTIDKILKFVSALVTKMFGGTVEGTTVNAEPVPIVAEMKEWSAQLIEQKTELLMQSEMKLIELKNKLVSPKLSPIERISYQALYDKIMLTYGSKISPATIATLNAIDQTARENTV